MINNFFPKKIHAVTQKGFALKPVSFILVFAIQFLQVTSWVIKMFDMICFSGIFCLWTMTF